MKKTLIKIFNPEYRPLLLYVLLSVLLFRFYQYKLFPDTISYISIAEKYATGDIADAINGYFSPLYSWLLVPFLWMKLESLIAIKILSLLIGAVTLVVFRKLLSSFNISDNVASVVNYTLVPILLYFSFSYNTPDLLMAMVLLIYFRFVFSDHYILSKKTGLLTGVWGGLAYLSKHYAFPVFLLHFFIMNVLYFFGTEHGKIRKNILLNYVTGMIVFLIISGSWILPISHKYGQLTISTSVAYMNAYMHPHTRGHIISHDGLSKPAVNNAVSAWEDPSDKIDQTWNPLESWSNMKHQIKLSLEFIQRIFTYFLLFSTLSVAIMIAYFIRLWPIHRSDLSKRPLFPLIALICYTSGFVLVLPVERYVWITEFLILIMGGVLLSDCLKNRILSGSRAKIAIILFVVSFLIFPLYQLGISRNEGKKIHDLATVLSSEYQLKGNIASFSDFKSPLYLAFYLDSHFYGPVKDNADCEEIKTELIKNKIYYYFVFGDKRDRALKKYIDCTHLNFLEELPLKTIEDVHVFRVINTLN